MPKTSGLDQTVRSVQNATKCHEWPAECGDCNGEDLMMFSKAQQQRSFDDWTSLDLITLGNLAKMQSDLTKEHDKLRVEGSITFGGKTGLVPIQNPRCRVVSELVSAVNTISRRLGLTHTSQNDTRSRAKRGNQERDARSHISDDDNTVHSSRRNLI